jgi:ribosome-associated heat shock protein Hsp15
MTETETMRIDKWLWAARFFKTRGEAQRVVIAGHLRMDGDTMTKPHRQVRPGQVLTFAKGNDVRVIKVVAMASRRGPASEAQLLYEDLAPPQPRAKRDGAAPKPFERRDAGSGRPTKRERRQIDQLKN